MRGNTAIRHSDESPPVVTQLPAADRTPSTSVRLLTSALMHATTPAVVLASPIRPDDLDEPHKTIQAAVIGLAERGITGPNALCGELLRLGQVNTSVQRELDAALTAGGVDLAINIYAADVLAERLRAAANSHGHALIEVAANGAEVDLWATNIRGAERVRKLADRLAQLRGGNK